MVWCTKLVVLFPRYSLSFLSLICKDWSQLPCDQFGETMLVTVGYLKHFILIHVRAFVAPVTFFFFFAACQHFIPLGLDLVTAASYKLQFHLHLISSDWQWLQLSELIWLWNRLQLDISSMMIYSVFSPLWPCQMGKIILICQIWLCYISRVSVTSVYFSWLWSLQLTLRVCRIEIASLLCN